MTRGMLVYLVPTTISLFAVTITDWEGKCEKPLRAWALTQGLLQASTPLSPLSSLSLSLSCIETHFFGLSQHTVGHVCAQYHCFAHTASPHCLGCRNRIIVLKTHFPQNKTKQNNKRHSTSDGEVHILVSQLSL